MVIVKVEVFTTMFVPVFSFLGVPPTMTLLDPTTVFTPLTCGLAVLSGACGLGLTLLLASLTEKHSKGAPARHTPLQPLSKAA